MRSTSVPVPVDGQRRGDVLGEAFGGLGRGHHTSTCIDAGGCQYLSAGAPGGDRLVVAVGLVAVGDRGGDAGERCAVCHDDGVGFGGAGGEERPVDGQLLGVAAGAEDAALVWGDHVRDGSDFQQLLFEGGDPGDVAAVGCQDLHDAPVDGIGVLSDHG